MGRVSGVLAVVLAGAVFALPALADGPIEGRDGRAELRFLEGMMDHHQMALDMANDCLVHASADELTTLCGNIIDAQSAEIAQMQGWLLDWYQVSYAPAPMMTSGDMAGMDMSATAMPDMTDMPATDPTMMMGMMAGLNRVEGTDYDIAFLESMIDHHDDAIHMSERILERGVHTETAALAEAIIADQSAEIETMEALLTELSGN